MRGVPLGPGPEFDRIRAIASVLGDRAGPLGDDCALLPAGAETLCLSIDATVEGVHFERDWLGLEEIGWRAAAAALSDLAAMGARVDGVLAALSAPRSAPAELTTALMRGVGEAAAAAGGLVLGGDLTGGDRVAITVAVVGRTARPVSRRGARAGDALWVTGTLGGARAALEEWRRGRIPPPGARAAFARPRPRIEAGRWLAERGATAMIDLSDGLAGDAAHLARASGVGIRIELERLPIHPDVPQLIGVGGEPAVVFAARGGEDYELLVALPADLEPGEGPGRIGLTRIGSIVPGNDVRLELRSEPVRLAGFDHFA